MAKFSPNTTPPCSRRRLQCGRVPPRWKVEILSRGTLTISTPPMCSSTSSAPTVPSQAPERTINELPHAIYHPHRHREGEVRKGHDSLLAENRQRAGRVSARVLAALLTVERHSVVGKNLAGLRGRDMDDGHHCRGYATVAVPRLEEIHQNVT